MLKPGRFAWHTACLALVLTACSETEDQQAIRHVVIAELIEREHVLDTNVEIEEVRIEGQQRAFVRATVRGRGGRFGSVRTYRCELDREGGRWVVRRVHSQ